MFFCWDITILKDTKEDDPLEEWLSLPKGIITSVEIKFPRGCHGMVKVRLFKEALQLVPLAEDEWVTGDGESVPTETYAELLDFPYKLKLKACSPDTDYDHVITVRIGVEEEESASMAKLTKLMQMLLDELGIEVTE